MTIKKVTILGSTGTIGQNTVGLIAGANRAIKHPPLNPPPQAGGERWSHSQAVGERWSHPQAGGEFFEVAALTARRNVKLLAKQAKELNAELAVIEDESLYDELKNELSGSGIKIASGKKAVSDAAALSADVVISGIVGAAALAPTLAAIKQGAIIGLANKECLVCAGEIVMRQVQKHGATVIPVDSEHNSLFQCFDFNSPKTIEKITLTASGGPFREFTIQQMQNVTPKMAINHPNWSMGAKISVDSATMMNKGLEIIEAYHLFPVAKSQIDAVVHPQSIIHSLVSYVDGSVIAGLSVPDMRVPISYALGWPNRMAIKASRLDLAEISSLTFEKPDTTKFPALKLAADALETGGAAPAILNAANEIAVESFVSEKIGFLTIIEVVEGTLEKMQGFAINSLEDVFAVDAEARNIAINIIRKN